MSNKLKILFLCTGNSCRSHMAEGWTRHLKDDRIDVSSAGIETHGLNSDAVFVMAEAGVDISNHKSRHIDEFKNKKFDYVITVCGHAHETCPRFPRKAKIIHIPFNDPPMLAAKFKGREDKLDCYRQVRDEIRAFVITLPESLLKPNLP
ncbi:MAG: arsenate reductase ArsC [archaeon]|nr:arsenate reductase ArsC [archaeon]